MSAGSDGSFASRFTDEILDNIFLQLSVKQVLLCECVCVHTLQELVEVFFNVLELRHTGTFGSCGILAPQADSHHGTRF